MSTETLREALVLTLPDTKAMEAARQHINKQVAALKLDFLPAMKEKMRPLQAAISSADKVYREKLASITAQLNNVNLQLIDEKQQQIEANESLDEKRKQQALGHLNRQRIREMSNLTTAVRTSARAIAEHSDDVWQINLKLDGNSLLETLQQQIDTFTQNAASRESRMSAIAEDRRLLDTTIATYEKYNLADQFKEMLPTPEELKLVTMPSPELGLVTAGIARLGKLLDKVSSALKYLDLIEERDRLRLRYNTLLTEAHAAIQEARATKEKLDELTGLAAVDQSKASWVQEAKKVYQSLYSFLDEVTSQKESSLSMTQHVEQLKAYIKSFYDINRIL